MLTACLCHTDPDPLLGDEAGLSTSSTGFSGTPQNGPGRERLCGGLLAGAPWSGTGPPHPLPRPWVAV